MFDLAAYLKRLRYEGDAQPNLATLRALHSLHLKHIPYENLDIMQGLSYNLEPEALFEKMVVQKRGGFCYELNGLFACLLRAMGFSCEIVSARIHQADGKIGEEFDHALLVVSLESMWIADVGNARWFHQPLRLNYEPPQEDSGRIYQVVPHDEGYLLLLEGADGAQAPQYQFTTRPRELTDFQPMCDYKWTSPQSRFTQDRICSRVTEQGRVMLYGRRFLKWKGWEREERVLESESEAEFETALWEYFGLTVTRE